MSYGLDCNRSLIKGLQLHSLSYSTPKSSLVRTSFPIRPIFIDTMFSRLSRAVANEYNNKNAHSVSNEMNNNPVWDDIVRACCKRGSTAGDQDAICVNDGGEQEAQSIVRLSGRKRSRSDYEGPLEFTPNKRTKVKSGKLLTLVLQYWNFLRRGGKNIALAWGL